MRLLILWPDYQTACSISSRLELEGWETVIHQDGRALLKTDEAFDVVLLHLCLAGMDGLTAGDTLFHLHPVCPPRILFAAPAEWCVHHPQWADGTVDSSVSIPRLCTLLQIIARKPLPKLALQNHELVCRVIETFLNDLCFKPKQKGRAYAAWLLERLIPSPSCDTQILTELYADCARAFHTTAAAVERCLRVAIETVFTQGSLAGIERFFGATVDPERVKPTNRAFLMQAAQQLRYSLTATRSLNSSEMHHNPAAPTSV